MAVTIAVAAASIASVTVKNANGVQDSRDFLSYAAVVAYTVVGVLILDRRPGQPIGRICLAMGLVSTAALMLQMGAISLDAQPGTLPPAGAAMAVIASSLFPIAFIGGVPFLVSRFPNGASPGWQRRLQDLFLVAVAVAILQGVFRPGPLDYGWVSHVSNPLGATGFQILGSGDAFTVSIFGFVGAYLLASAGLVLRYRRGATVDRAQIRWLVASIGTTLAILGAVIVAEPTGTVGDIAYQALIVTAILLPPFAIGIAILRYRLYDIDRIVSNTVAYAAVTVVLFAVFALVNLALQNALNGVTNGDGLPVAFSTLVAAALFNPVRVRVQRAVDRRFHRAHYDAELMVAAFATRLRDELDLRTLADELAATTTRAVEPSMTSVWLREGGR
ncbi:MAG: hypothetical protein ABJC39_09045 [Chloroflexota bacterium]